MLADPRLGLLRAKGFFRTAGGEFVTLHVIGRRSIVEVAPLWIDALDNLCVLAWPPRWTVRRPGGRWAAISVRSCRREENLTNSSCLHIEPCPSWLSPRLRSLGYAGGAGAQMREIECQLLARSGRSLVREPSRHHPQQQSQSTIAAMLISAGLHAALQSGCIFAESMLCATVFGLQKRRRRMVRDIREGN
jgi:hypothetical protein